jgi:hypothetical protein
MVLQDGNFSSEAFKAWGAKEIKSLFEDSADGSDATKPDANTMEADNDGPSTAADQEVDIGEVQQAMASVEEETDNAAAKRAERESAAAEEDFREEKEPAVDKVNMEQKARREFLLALKRGRKGKDSSSVQSAAIDSSQPEFDWETDLLPIQQYGMDFLMKVFPMVDTRQSVEKLDYQEQVWELDKLQQLKEEEEAKIDEDDDVLYYEVAGPGKGSRETELAELRSAYLDSQKIAQEELAKQQQILVVGPPTTVMLEPDVSEPRPPPEQEPRRDEKPPRRRPNKPGPGSGDGLFNRPSKRPTGRRKYEQQNEHVGPPWSDKQNFALVFAVTRFGENWMRVSEVVSKSPATGPWRSREQCAARFRTLRQEEHSGLIQQQEELARQNREDARSVCHDPAAVKRFHELSRCVQKRVSDLGKQLSSTTTAAMAQTHTSHLGVLRNHLPTDKSAGIRSPDEIPSPTQSSRDRHGRVHPLKPVLSRTDPKRGAGRGASMHSPRGRAGAAGTAANGRSGYQSAQKRKGGPAGGSAAKRQTTVSAASFYSALVALAW